MKVNAKKRSDFGSSVWSRLDGAQWLKDEHGRRQRSAACLRTVGRSLELTARVCGYMVLVDA
jgi:hypothetical protein